MNRRIENDLLITCYDEDLKSISHIEFYVRQTSLFFCYTPDVISEHEMLVTVPFKDAMLLKSGVVELQFAYLNASGRPMSSEIEILPVNDFLKEAGYAPI